MPNRLPEPDFDEVLSQFPDLARARSGYTALFKDTKSLDRLGYTETQKRYAIPALRLLAESGTVEMPSIEAPYLHFRDPAFVKTLSVHPFQDHKGSYLAARRDQGMMYSDPLLAAFSKPPVTVFDPHDTMVAHMALFEEGAPIGDLDYLIPQLFSSFTEAKIGIRRVGLFTKVAEILGFAGNYKAAWTDERTRLEFVARIHFLEDIHEGFDPTYVVYRRLAAITERQGKMIPFGRRANASRNQMERILLSQEERDFETVLKPVTE